MTHRNEIFSDDLFNEMVEQKYIRVKDHPSLPLWIANYSEKAQYEKVWNPVTLACRGLIYDAGGHIVARPFRKFFNLGETEVQLGGGTVRVYAKEDGSLGILFWWNGSPHIATRGSFASDQAVWATAFLRRNWEDCATPPMSDTNRTYLFEIIYPNNRIVVDYNGQERLICLGAVDIATGNTIPDAHRDWSDPVEEHLFGDDLHGFIGVERPNREGYVLHVVETDERVKAKHAEYVRLHKIVTGITERSIWEILASGKPLADLLDHVPDEFSQWARDVAARLRKEFAELRDGWDAAYQGVLKDLAEAGCTEHDARTTREGRKAFALTAVMAMSRPSPLFLLVDGKSTAELAWQTVRPPADRPFHQDIDSGAA